jgi:TctA family transporter
MDNIFNSIVEFKNTVLNKFGTVLGTIILVICGLAAVSVLGFLLKFLFGIAVGLIIAACVIFGIYKLSEWMSAKK